VLACGTHPCREQCHAGPCAPCDVVLDRTGACCCGRDLDQAAPRRCGDPVRRCERMCGTPLPCGRCICDRTCCPHGGNAVGHPPCKVAVRGTCPCGKSQLPAGTDPHDAGSCGETCGAERATCSHPCPARCHAGPCPPCPLVVTTPCRCGAQRAVDVKCSTLRKQVEVADLAADNDVQQHHQHQQHQNQQQQNPQQQNVTIVRAPASQPSALSSSADHVVAIVTTLPTCDRRCAVMRNCGRHACRRRCCPGEGSCPPCSEPCGSRLSCGVHKCAGTCHAGPCGKCTLTRVVDCACGATRLELPCGQDRKLLPRGADPRTLVECVLPCRVEARCRHKVQKFHPCHPVDTSACPPCEIRCGARRADCTHTCGRPCHDLPPGTPASGDGGDDSHHHASANAKGKSKGKSSNSSAGASGTTTIALLAALESKSRPSSRGQMGGKRGGRAAWGGAAPPPPSSSSSAAVTPKWDTSCPPCKARVERACLGGHEKRTVKCSSRPFACDAKCGTPFSCGKHRCARPCHVRSEGGATCGVCERPCKRARDPPCPHPCASRCHGEFVCIFFFSF
jgi:hypothetical protein